MFKSIQTLSTVCGVHLEPLGEVARTELVPKTDGGTGGPTSNSHRRTAKQNHFFSLRTVAGAKSFTERSANRPSDLGKYLFYLGAIFFSRVVVPVNKSTVTATPI